MFNFLSIKMTPYHFINFRDALVPSPEGRRKIQLLYQKLKRKLKGDVIVAYFPTTFCSSVAQMSLEAAPVKSYSYLQNQTR